MLLRCVPRRRQGAEAGQVLPLTLAALMLGMVVVMPFVTQAGTTLIGSRNYGLIIKEGYAADSGVEHAVWRLLDDGLEAVLLGVGSSTNYTLPQAVNGMTADITVTKTSAGETPAGAIVDTVIDTLEFDTSEGTAPRMAPVSGSVYAIGYTGPGSDGFIKTVTIATDGQIGDTAIDTLEFDTGTGIEVDIIHVSGTTYAVAYRGSGSDGFIRTVTITADGQIGDSVLDTLEFDTADGFQPRIIHVSGTTYAVAYRGSGSDGFIKTVTIGADGQIGDTVIDTLEFDTADGFDPDIIHVAGDVYAIAYRGTGDDGFLVTVTVTAAGQIGNTVVDSLEYDTGNGESPDIELVAANVYLIAYLGPSNGGFLKTVEIAADGQITDAVIDSQQFDAVQGSEPSVLSIGNDLFAIAHRGDNSDGWVRTFEILPNGQIGNAEIDSLEFDTSDGFEPHLITVASGVCAIAYRGVGSDGFVRTVSISLTGAASSNTYEVQSVAGGCTVTAVVEITGGAPSLISWVVQR